MLVVPPALLLYITLASDEKIKYSSAGPAGPANFEAGVAGYEARAFRGLGVFTSNPFEVAEDSDSVQLLQRSTQVGEFYIMGLPKVMPTGDAPATAKDIVIYDEDMDRHMHITAAEAAAAATPNMGGENKFSIKYEGMDAITNAQTLLQAMEAKKVQILIARPFIEHSMLSAVVAVAGRDTGATLFGPAGKSWRHTLSHASALL